MNDTIRALLEGGQRRRATDKIVITPTKWNGKRVTLAEKNKAMDDARNGKITATEAALIVEQYWAQPVS